MFFFFVCANSAGVRNMKIMRIIRGTRHEKFWAISTRFGTVLIISGIWCAMFTKFFFHYSTILYENFSRAFLNICIFCGYTYFINLRISD